MEPNPDQLTFQESVMAGFKRAKSDISNLKEEVILIEGSIKDLSEKLALIAQISQNNAEKISLIIAKNPPSSCGTSSAGNERVPNAEDLLVRRFRQNRAAIVKQKIVDLLTLGIKSSYDIYVSLVMEQRLCGKTTFYRYLKELEQKNQLKVELIEGKRIINLIN